MKGAYKKNYRLLDIMVRLGNDRNHAFIQYKEILKKHICWTIFTKVLSSDVVKV
jgi:hypothetical protein